jgi:hypothetical protein
MAIKTYQVPPYVDDFAVQDINFNNKTAEEKNFLRILFKPGVSVQVRELNQMQSILQNQIDKVGRGVFKEGPVPELATEATLDRSVHYVDLDIDPALITGLVPYLNLVDEIRLDYNPAVSPQVFINAEVLHYQALPETNRFRFFIKYLNSVQDDDGDNVQKFDHLASPSQVVELANLITTELQTQYAAGTSFGTVVDTGRAIHAKSEEGVFFVKGQFVYAEDQDIYAKIPTEDYLINAKLVFKVVETIVNYQTDRSLLDNAAGYPNETAPGADRYTIDLQLSILSKDVSDNDQDFIGGHEKIFGYSTSIGDTLSLLEVDDGAVVQVARPEFSGITDVLAERTREESGDYALDPFLIDITGFYNDTTDNSKCGRGVYSAEQMLDSDVVIPDSDISEVSAGQLSEKSEADRIKFGESRFNVGVEPSVAYVDGYRIAEPEKINVTGRKARTTSEFQQTYSNANLGSYLLGTVFTGAPSFDVDTVYDITDTGGSNTFATCRVRSIERNGSQYRLYVYDIQFAGSYTSLTGATTITSGAFSFTIDTTDGVGLYDPQYNKSIYKLPADFIKSVKNQSGEIEFTARKIFNPVSSTATQVVIQVTSPDRFEEFGPNSYIVIDASGAICPVTSDPVLGGINNNQVTLTCSGTIDTNGTISVIASYRTSLGKRSKTLTSITDEVLSGDNTTVNTNSEIELANHDIIAITSAQDFAGNDIQLTDLVLDNGQRDGCYKKGRVKYIGSGIVASGQNTGGLKISYTYFAHGGGDYFSVDSYSVEYPEIPTYQDIRLSDALDFRAKLDGGDYGTYLDPNSTIDTQVQYYLSRIDKLVVTRESEFKLIEGIPNVVPEEPSVPSTAMHLYTLHIPAYTFCHTMIETSFIDNRRYTMRDIGNINSRVNNLEYYTTLSLLEREANGKQIFETSAGNPYDRFKNGIIVDSFAGHDVGNIFDSHYNCSMDSEDPVLRPYFETRSVPFTQTGDSADTNNVSINDGIATLSYDQGPAWIDQQKAAVSISVNPYDVATWLGSFKLSPSSDEWMETRRAPNIVNEVGGSLSDLRAEVDRVNQMGTRWNSWQTTWTGKPVTKTTMERRDRTGIPWGRGPGRGWVRRVTTTTTESKQVRTGIRTTARINSVTRQKDDRVIDVSFVPFIRARKVYFKGKLFKPNTKLKVFFDGEDITKYATGVVKNDYKEWSENASVRVYHNQSNTAITNSGGDIITDNKGEVYGWFVIPNNSEHQFSAGERKVILSDGKTATDPAASTSADAVYTAQGKVQTKQRTLITTRTVVRQSQRVSQSRIQSSNRVTRTQWYDPLAQSFIIGENPTGIFIHSVDLYFSHVSTKNVPIKMYLVEVENGMPTQRRVPLSDVIKQPNEVATSSDATAATTFEFDSPLYLQYGTEYAIVTESNSSHYRQWLSEVGKDDVTTGEYISKNPFLGVSFKSQNASTWTPDQMKDFKMVVRRADYQTSGSIILQASGISSAITDESDGPLEFSQIQLNTDFIEHPETNVLYQISVDGGSNYEVIVPNENHYISTTTPITDNSDIKIKITMESNNSKVSPVVDLDRISLIAVKNIIGAEDSAELAGSPLDNVSLDSLIQYDVEVSPPVKIDSELSADHGNATAVYMTKEVALNNASDRLDSYLNINKPYADSNVLVYARFKRSEDNIEDVAFERIDPSTPIPINDFDDYSEIQYTRDFSADSPVPPLFTSFQIKIVLVSNDHALVPTVKDFRAIATI